MTHQSRFLALTQQLNNFSPFWRESPYYEMNVPWRAQWPALDRACLALSDDEFEALDQNPQALGEFLVKFVPEYQPIIALTEQTVSERLQTLEPRLGVGVPGRKWQQLRAFAAALPEAPASGTATVVDWCAGKSYMGRAVAHHWQCGLHAVERDQALCDDGQQQASRWVTSSQFTQKDVLLESHNFACDEFVTALHACGDLHRTLLAQWRASESRQLAFAPCCYHQWLEPAGYTPLSACGLAHDLKLKKKQVRLAVQEMVTANRATRLQVRQLGEWRMAFDLLQRELRNLDEYLPIDSIPYSRVKRGAAFVLNALAEQKGLTIPADLDLEPYLQQGKLRYAQYLRLQLVGQAFRRALELWLVLDLVVYLEEGGCEVDLTCFCPREITPRNFRVFAKR